MKCIFMTTKNFFTGANRINGQLFCVNNSTLEDYKFIL